MENKVRYTMSGDLAATVGVHDCGNVGHPELVVVDFGGVRLYTENANLLLENLRTAALELARIIAKQRDTERAENE